MHAGSRYILMVLPFEEVGTVDISSVADVTVGVFPANK